MSNLKKQDFFERFKPLSPNPTRRNFLALALLPLANSYIKGQAPTTISDDRIKNDLQELLGIAHQLTEKEPKLPGVVNLRNWVSSELPKDLAREDQEILLAAIYLETLNGIKRKQLTVRQRQLTTEQLRKTLQKPLILNKFEKNYFNNLLERTKSRMKTDVQFSKEVKSTQQSLPKLLKKILLGAACALVVFLAIVFDS